jgi:uncharacterized membrane protein
MMNRAMRRLGVLEVILLALAAVAALAAGALTGWLLNHGLGWSFRWVWSTSSLLYFVVPGGIAWWKSRRDELRRQTRKGEDRNVR